MLSQTVLRYFKPARATPLVRGQRTCTLHGSSSCRYRKNQQRRSQDSDVGLDEFLPTMLKDDEAQLDAALRSPLNACWSTSRVPYEWVISMTSRKLLTTSTGRLYGLSHVNMESISSLYTPSVVSAPTPSSASRQMIGWRP